MDSKGKRKSERHPLPVDLSKILLLGPERKPSRSMGVDVSDDGLGIIGFEVLEPNLKGMLLLNGKELPVTVVWSKPDPNRQGIFRSGLVLVGGGISLVDEFQTAGFLKVVKAFEFRKLTRK